MTATQGPASGPATSTVPRPASGLTKGDRATACASSDHDVGVPLPSGWLAAVGQAGVTHGALQRLRGRTDTARGDAARRAGVEKAERESRRTLELTDDQFDGRAQFGLGLGSPGRPVDLTSPVLN